LNFKKIRERLVILAMALYVAPQIVIMAIFYILGPEPDWFLRVAQAQLIILGIFLGLEILLQKLSSKNAHVPKNK